MALYGSLWYYLSELSWPKNQVTILHIWSAQWDPLKGIWKLILTSKTVRNIVIMIRQIFILKNLKVKLLIDNWISACSMMMNLATKTIHSNNSLAIVVIIVLETISSFFSHSLTATNFATMLKMILFVRYTNLRPQDPWGECIWTHRK